MENGNFSMAYCLSNYFINYILTTPNSKQIGFTKKNISNDNYISTNNDLFNPTHDK
ncbi:hypothetical protein [Flavobacterium soyangense]|uniref:hypothetical protein n=1 Tax=Flavobacterium soyangense TaxID=2023265 RepID=UPI001888D53C|nr:hypothetical protein [Flavobacterium soyangense]